MLGFNDKGRELLAEMRDGETASLPVIIKKVLIFNLVIASKTSFISESFSSKILS